MWSAPKVITLLRGTAMRFLVEKINSAKFCGIRGRDGKTPVALGDFVFFPVVFIFRACTRIVFGRHLRFPSHSELCYCLGGKALARVRGASARWARREYF